MELLAPAGGMEQLKAALRFGADAVYGGMKQYGLRAFAGNFDEAALAEAAEQCHKQGAKFYVTMNILPTAFMCFFLTSCVSSFICLDHT